MLGESLGGGTGILVDRLRPGLVRRLLLCEAIAMPSVGGLPGRRAARTTCRRWRGSRRAVWPDRATVRESYGSRPPLNVMEPAALAGYVQWGFRDRPDGQVELACPPEVEAWFFECGTRPDGAPAVVRAPRVAARRRRRSCAPTAPTCPTAMFAAQAARAGVELVTVHGHPLLRAGGHGARRRARARAPRVVSTACARRAHARAPTRSRACRRSCG